MIEYIEGQGPVPRTEWEVKDGRPSVQSRIWREGDTGCVADIIEAAWARWLSVYPREWRTVGQAIPYVHLREAIDCHRPKTHSQWARESCERMVQEETWQEALERWHEEGRVGPEPEEPGPYALGHTHEHDHGICIDPWIIDHPSQHDTFGNTLTHELAHAIAGSFGHGGEWIGMCEVIGHELSPHERGLGEPDLETGNNPEAEEPCEHLVGWLEP